jgi:predicted HicB family RNase H-like nuclease
MGMRHRGYTGSVEYSAPDRVFHGELNGIRDVITFEGSTEDELESAFKEAVDDYLAFCAKKEFDPQRPYTGRFVLRLPAEMEGEISVASRAAKESMNAWVLGAVEARLAEWRATRLNSAAAERRQHAPGE